MTQLLARAYHESLMTLIPSHWKRSAKSGAGR